MDIIFQILAVAINLIIFTKTFRKVKYNLRIGYVILLIFQAVFVFPIVLEWFLGVQNYHNKFPGFDKALNDNTTNIIYSMFAIITSMALYFSVKKNKRVQMLDIRTTILNLRIKREFYLISVSLMFLPLLLVLFSPSPDKYLTEYAYFQRFSNLATASEIWYHRNVMRIGGLITLVFVVVSKMLSKNTRFNNFLIYFAAIIAGILNGKRTLLTFIIFAILAVDILKSPKGKFPTKKIIFSGLFFIAFFVGYAFLIDKHTVNVTTIDSVRQYFFRDIDVKFSIYALLNPDEYKVLDHWGQSYLYNISFYIPRVFWTNKPYPYATYVTAAVFGYSPGTLIDWNFQTSIFGEALSNMGWVGIPFSLIMINKFINLSERSKNPIIIALCIFIIMFSFMNHFMSWSNYFLIWLLLIVRNKIPRNIASKKAKIESNNDYTKIR